MPPRRNYHEKKALRNWDVNGDGINAYISRLLRNEIFGR